MAQTKLELYLSAEDLRRADVFSKSDPFAVVSIANKAADLQNPSFVEIGRSETISNCHDPVWSKQFVVDFSFNVEQLVLVKIFDSDTVSNNDALGQVTFRLAAVVAAAGQMQRISLERGDGSGAQGTGCLTVRCEEMAHSNECLELQLAGIKLPKKDGLFGKSDPFYTVSRLREDGSWMKVHSSEVIRNNLSPQWKLKEIPVQPLCNGDHARPLKIDIWDWDRDGSNDYMCSVTTSLDALLALNGGGEVAAKDEKKGNKEKGKLKVVTATLGTRPTLLEFIRGGLQIGLVVAVDFTGSNGDPSSSSSLHYMDPSHRQLNQYQHAILSIGSILEEYDHDKRFPVFGFGGKLVSGGPTLHCFDISASESGEVQQGVKGIFDAYESAIRRVALSGPTLFAEIISTAAAHAASSSSGSACQSYTVLLILTDGIINDMEATKDALVAASGLPLSIIIVGVGAADFSEMEALDGDDGVLKDSRGRACERDIVQFVPFRNFTGAGASPAKQGQLAAETLAEVPRQLLDYMSSKGVVPQKARKPIAALAPLSASEQLHKQYQQYQQASAPAAFDDAAPPSYEESVGGK